MADIIQKEVVLQDFLLVLNSNATRTLDKVLLNGTEKAKTIVVVKGTRELNAPSDDTSIEKAALAADSANARKSARASVSNVCEVISKFVSLSDTETILENARLANEVSDAIIEIKQDLNKHIWDGSKSLNDPRKMGHILTETPAGHKSTVTKAELTKDVITAAVKKIKAYATIDTIYGSQDAINQVVKAVSAAETRTQNDGTINLDITSITISGQKLEVVIDETLVDKVVFGASKMLEFNFLKELSQVELAKRGRTVDYMIDVECTILNRNPKAWFQITISDL